MFEPHENEIRSAKLASRDAKRARKRFAKNSLERKNFQSATVVGLAN